MAAPGPGGPDPFGAVGGGRHPDFRQPAVPGAPAVHPIETLDQLGVWERYMPEWASVRNQPQFNPYHRWSVDRHLLETVANAAGHVRDVRRPDLLVLGALLHDIGKGTGGDHSEHGARHGGRSDRTDGPGRRRPGRLSQSWSATTCCCRTLPRDETWRTPSP